MWSVCIPLIIGSLVVECDGEGSQRYKTSHKRKIKRIPNKWPHISLKRISLSCKMVCSCWYVGCFYFRCFFVYCSLFVQMETASFASNDSWYHMVLYSTLQNKRNFQNIIRVKISITFRMFERLGRCILTTKAIVMWWGTKNRNNRQATLMTPKIFFFFYGTLVSLFILDDRSYVRFVYSHLSKI